MSIGSSISMANKFQVPDYHQTSTISMLISYYCRWPLSSLLAISLLNVCAVGNDFWLGQHRCWSLSLVNNDAWKPNKFQCWWCFFFFFLNISPVTSRSDRCLPAFVLQHHFLKSEDDLLQDEAAWLLKKCLYSTLKEGNSVTKSGSLISCMRWNMEVVSQDNSR